MAIKKMTGGLSESPMKKNSAVGVLTSKLSALQKEIPSFYVKSKEDPIFIGTGNYLLNACINADMLNGGIMAGRISAFLGDSGAGKTYLAMSICKEAQKMGYHIVYFDTENAVEYDTLQNIGLDVSPDMLTLVSINRVNALAQVLVGLLDELKQEKKKTNTDPKIMMVIDSVAMMTSDAEMKGLLEQDIKADMGKRAQEFAKLFRAIPVDLGYLNIPMICTNHVYKTLDMFPKDVGKGGTGLYYASSLMGFMSKAKYKTGEEDELDMGQSGIVVTFKAQKNRLAQSKQIKFAISFTDGINPYMGLEYFCTPENFEQVGIAKGKMVEDKTTKKMVFQPGGNNWYVRHLGKSVPSKRLFEPEVFTQEVLEALAPILKENFAFVSEEQRKTQMKAVDEIYQNYDKDVEIDEDGNAVVDVDQLFS